MNDKLTPTEARQGRRGTQVLVILVVALILLAIGWWLVEIYGGAIAPEDPVGGDPVEQPADVAPTQPAPDAGAQPPGAGSGN